jgi:hypothetical protein
MMNLLIAIIDSKLYLKTPRLGLHALDFIMMEIHFFASNADAKLIISLIILG